MASDRAAIRCCPRLCSAESLLRDPVLLTDKQAGSWLAKAHSGLAHLLKGYRHERDDCQANQKQQQRRGAGAPGTTGRRHCVATASAAAAETASTTLQSGSKGRLWRRVPPAQCSQRCRNCATQRLGALLQHTATAATAVAIMFL